MLTHVYSHVRRPKENGYVERFIRTMSEEFLSKLPTGESIQEYNRFLLGWLLYYKTERPHAEINYRTPVEELIMLTGNRYLTLNLSQLFQTNTNPRI